MEFTNGISEAFFKNDGLSASARPALEEAVKSLVILLSPFVPHACEEMWEALGGKPGMTKLDWPQYDPSVLVEDEVVIVVQVNGKKRGEVRVPADATEDEIKETALAEPNVGRFTEGKTIRKAILVPGKLLNLVAN